MYGRTCLSLFKLFVIKEKHAYIYIYVHTPAYTIYIHTCIYTHEYRQIDRLIDR